MSILIVNAWLQIPLAEFSLSFARSSGPGGQNVNKVNSKAVLSWNVMLSPNLPPGVRARFVEAFQNRITTEGFLVLSSDRTRDQQQNIADCYDKVQAMLLSVAVPPKKRTATKPTRGSKERRLDAKKRRGATKATRKSGWD